MVKIRHFLLCLLLSFDALDKCLAGLLNGINVGLTIPAMDLNLPAPSFPAIKLKTIVIKPPKQSLKSLLPRFTYNIPTFSEDSWDVPGMYAASAPTASVYKQSTGSSAMNSNNHMTNQKHDQAMRNHLSSTASLRPQPIQLGQFAKLPNPYMTTDELQTRYALSPEPYYQSSKLTY